MGSVSQIEVGKLEIEYEEWGEGDRSFVLVHGFTGSRDDWREQLPALAPLGRTLALDLRGHGGSTNPGVAEAYSLDILADDLVRFLDALAIERCDLLGHSMGGMAALRLVLAHPDRIGSLVLMDTAARGIGFLPQKLWQGTVALIRSQGMLGLAKVMREQAARDPKRPLPAARVEARLGSDAFWGRIEAKLGAMDPEAFLALGPGLEAQESLLPRLSEIRCPTLVLVGELDQSFLEPADELEQGIADARRVTIPDAAHSPQLENPALWLEAIREHLARARAG